ncbi:ABC-F family ATP-binding cassette domain-containing protein [Aquabacterium sp. OR-4]|uniref:ABC-F family ATP-binding cassette domain-containing protein n=1 Tax=Aquabacterium sp. OR-4 TaxID=2978127 RepID=UPI0021B40D49|nr:ATP-binding cassette domain-containing protein [Aquabacterium sp. OR-4]MDT7834896.1 ATP-binding cassette domain-containing protein [Aquabacterium sp. OR-4]
MIQLKNLTLRRGVKVVLQDASVTLNPGEHVGLVGRNGAGKSSLFALLAGRLQADAGDAERPPTWRLGEVAQHMPETEQPATEFVLDGDIPLLEARQLLEAAELSGDGHAIAEAHMALEQAGTFDARARAQALLLGLGFKIAQLDAPVNSFSGGWRMRLQLARALMCPADLLLLDEPTNHLDLDALVWLEGWLKRFAGLMIVISHDREFLDAITKVTLHLDEARLTRYGGNYTTFEEMRAERMSQQAAAFGRQQEKMAQLQRFIDRFKAKASKAKQAQSRVKALARMEKLAPVLADSEFEFNFREPGNLPNPMLTMRDLVCGYMAPPVGESADTPAEGAVAPAAAKVIVRNINRTVLAGQRIGILGANGQGKSTLVKTIAHALQPIEGTLTEGKGLAIGYFAQQELDLLSEDDTPLQRMVRLARELGAGGQGAREQELRNFLGQFRFTGDMVHQKVGTLSGGERARLVMATIVWQKPNLLLLDEPTNHLDLSTREALSIALNEFEGTVLLVSHDRALLREVCDEFWLVTSGGVEPFDGDLDDYQKWLLEVSRAVARGQEPPPPPRPVLASTVSGSAEPKGSGKGGAATAAPAAKVVDNGNRRDDRKAAAQARSELANKTRPLRNELLQIDARLEKLGQEKAALETRLAAAGVSAADLAEMGRRLNHIAAEVAMQEERWLELQGQIEAINATLGG